MKISESLAELIAALEESDRRFREEVDGLLKATDRIIKTVDQMVEED
jgi:nitrate reductase assembly molybdenum cofactor insertion protein NarJ